MNHRNSKSILVLALLSGLALAPVAQAAEINRNTGVGLLIAAQGNAALRYIQSTLHLSRPALPKAHVVKVSSPAPVAPGGTMSESPATAGMRCAE